MSEDVVEVEPDVPAGFPAMHSRLSPRRTSGSSFTASLRLGAAAALLAALSATAQPQPNAATDSRAARRIAIEGLSEPLSNLTVSDFDGRDLTEELKPQTDAGRVTVALRRPTQFVVKPRTIVTMAAPAEGRITLPGGVVVPLIAQPDGSTPATSAWFRLTFAASPMPAPWDPAAPGYITRLTFGLRRPPQLSEDVALERPVIVKLGFEGLTATEVPPLVIEAPGLENEKTIELRFQPRTATPRLLVRSTISDVNLELSALARLDVRPQQRAMLGYGLETVPVVIENVLAHGVPRPVEQATPIAIELDGGARAESEEVAFAAGASSTSIRVRSSGTGPATVTATAQGLVGRAVIEQRFPTGPLIAALLGGALGGFARRFVKGARRARSRRQTLEGAVVALVAFVAGVLGVGHLNLPAALVATEAGAFLVGALTGFAGVAVMEMLGRSKRERAAGQT